MWDDDRQRAPQKVLDKPGGLNYRARAFDCSFSCIGRSHLLSPFTP